MLWTFYDGMKRGNDNNNNNSNDNKLKLRRLRSMVHPLHPLRVTKVFGGHQTFAGACTINISCAAVVAKGLSRTHTL